MKKIILLFLIFVLGTSVGYAFRVPRPPTLSNPLTAEQINQLNSYLEDLWNMQNGRFNLDIVTSTKSNADKGDIWILNSGGTIKLQTNVGGTIYSTTMTP